MLVTMDKVLSQVPVKNEVGVLPYGVNIGDTVPFNDGTYTCEDKIAIVQEGRVLDIYNVVEGQLEFQF